MTTDEFEREVVQTAARFAYIHQIAIVDKTTHTVKLRLRITSDCFVQIYANTAKGLYSYTLVLRNEDFIIQETIIRRFRRLTQIFLFNLRNLRIASFGFNLILVPKSTTALRP